MPMVRDARHVVVCLLLAVVMALPEVRAFSGGGLRASLKMLPHESHQTTSAAVVSPPSRTTAAFPPRGRRLSFPPLSMVEMGGSNTEEGRLGSAAEEQPGLVGSEGDSFLKCSKCLACYPIDLSVLGSGRSIVCSVCNHKWFQTVERALALNSNVLMKEWTEERTKDALEQAKASPTPRPSSFAPKFSGFDLFVGNIPFSVHEKDLSEIFQNFGKVLSTTLVKEPTGESKGYGFVKMETDAEGQKAISALNGVEIQGRKMLVKAGASNNSSSGGRGGRMVGRGGRGGGRGGRVGRGAGGRGGRGRSGGGNGGGTGDYSGLGF